MKSSLIAYTLVFNTSPNNKPKMTKEYAIACARKDGKRKYVG